MGKRKVGGALCRTAHEMLRRCEEKNREGLRYEQGTSTQRSGTRVVLVRKLHGSGFSGGSRSFRKGSAQDYFSGRAAELSGALSRIAGLVDLGKIAGCARSMTAFSLSSRWKCHCIHAPGHGWLGDLRQDVLWVHQESW